MEIRNNITNANEKNNIKDNDNVKNDIENKMIETNNVYENNLVFTCLRCGKCCSEIPEGEKYENDTQAYKRIPLYPEETERLEKLAEEMKIKFQVIEDLVFPDIINKKILVLTYRILLTDNNHCPFYSISEGCRIHQYRPLACQAYPLAIKTEDAFNSRIDIDPLCSFTIQNRKDLEGITFNELTKIYSNEYLLARNLLKRNKQAIMYIRGLESTNKIKIPRQIEPEEYSKYLKEWDREILVIPDD